MKNLLVIPLLLALSFQVQAGTPFNTNEYELLVRADSTHLMDKSYNTQEAKDKNTINWSWI